VSKKSEQSARKEARKTRGKKAYRRGLWAEGFCRAVLWLKGYRIVAARYKTRHGEIDLIVARGRTLAFVEVKARPDAARAGEAISRPQQERLARAASAFLARARGLSFYDVRFDAMLVLPWRWPVHIQGAFVPSETSFSA